MIETFEIANNSNSHCVNCKKQILKGEARGIEFGNYNNHIISRYYCLRCSKKMLKELLKEASKYIELK